ncbi:MAG TPA: cation diffusion facilitator family transporter [Patescibacteria group bacterium]
MQKPVSSRRVVLTSFVVDLSDVLLNTFIAVVSGSVVMASEALQGLADLLTSGLLLIGLKQSRRRANKSHRFGYGREIYFWTLMSGIMMLTLTAGLSFYFGLNRFFHPEPIDKTPLALGVLLIGLATNAYACYLSYQRLHAFHPRQKLWKTFQYSDLIETKATFILDSMGALAALFGFLSLGLFAITGNSRFDSVGAMLIGVLIAVLSFFLILEVKDLLVGRAASPELEEKIRESALSIKGVQHILDLRTMYLGTERLLVNLEIHVKDNLTTDQIEQLTDAVKHRIKQRIPSVKHIQVELESPDEEL